MNGRRGHRRDIDLFLDLLESLFVRDTEPLLFINDHQAEIVKLDVLRKQPVSPDNDIDLAGLEIGYDFLLFFRIDESAQHDDRDWKCRKPLFERFEMLIAKNGGWRQYRNLFPVPYRLESRAHRYFGLAIANIAADQPVHRHWRLYIPFNVDYGRKLVRCLLVLKCFFKFFLPFRVWGKRITVGHFAFRVKFQKLLGHVADRALSARLSSDPSRPAELVQLRLRALGRRIFLNQVQTLKWNV